MLFLLTGAEKNMDFLGTKLWLEASDSSILHHPSSLYSFFQILIYQFSYLALMLIGVLESIDLALCIDTIGGSGLNLFVSRSPLKDEKAKYIYSVFENVAKSMNIPFKLVHKVLSFLSSIFIVFL